MERNIIKKVYLGDVCSKCKEEKKIAFMLGYEEQRVIDCFKLCDECVEKDIIE